MNVLLNDMKMILASSKVEIMRDGRLRVGFFILLHRRFDVHAVASMRGTIIAQPLQLALIGCRPLPAEFLGPNSFVKDSFARGYLSLFILA